MGVVDSLKKDGWKPELNMDGEFKPLVGTYKAEIIALRPEIDTKNGNAKYYQLEVKPLEMIYGDTFGDKFTFRKRYYIDGEKGAANLQKMLNDLFTCGIELDTQSDEHMEADFEKAIGKTAFVRSWGWKKDDGNTAQMFVIQQEKVALKKKKSDTPF